MRPFVFACSALCFALSSVLTVGCEGPSDPTGKYYCFYGGPPSSDTFTALDGPIATLMFEDENRWRIYVIMAEDVPIGGTWSRNGEAITLTDDVAGLAGTLKKEGPFLSMESSNGFLARMQGRRFYKMSKAWEESFRQSSMRDTILQVAGDIARCAIIYAGDNDETLPTTQAEFEKALEPYVVDKQMFVGFIYTFKGGKLPDEAKRGSVELGIYYGSTGNVITFLNGATKWVPLGGDREYVQAYESLVRRFDNAVANLNRRLDAARRDGFPEDPQAKRELLIQLAAADAADMRKLHEQATAIEAPTDFVPVHSAMVAYFDHFAKGMEHMVQTFRSGRSQTESEMQQEYAPLRALAEKWTKEAKNAGVLLPKDYRQTKP